MKLINRGAKLYGTVACLPVFTIILFWLAWPPGDFSFLIFIGFIPLFFLEELFQKKYFKKSIYLLLCYVAILGWNVTCSYWLYSSALVTTIAVQFINSIFLSVPFWLLPAVKSRLGKSFGYIFWVSCWLTIELFQHSWEFAYPLLTLGNGLAKYASFIQFYEFTGVLGGSLWVLVVNVFGFELLSSLLRNRSNQKVVFPIKTLATCLTIIIVPSLVSLLIYYSYEENGKAVEVVAIHPNLNCRSEKYVWPQDSILKRYVRLTNEQLTANTSYILWPETAIPNAGWFQNLNESKELKNLMTTLEVHKDTKLVTGAIIYAVDTDPTRNVLNPGLSQYHEPSRVWYKTYNSAIQLSSQTNQMYFRSKKVLVPMEETIPFNGKMAFLKTYFPSMGGFLFSKRKNDNTIFSSKDNTKVLSLICYESAFGAKTARMAKKGANLIFVILNEGWYKNITGASQFMYMARLRAIENRRAIARSSNDGISCFINQKGDIIQSESAFKPTAIRNKLITNSDTTFYMVFEDYLGKISLAVSLLISLIYLYRRQKSILN